MVGRLKLVFIALFGLTFAEELPEVSVTATRTERETKDVPASIAVVGKERIGQRPMFNLQDALSGTPGVNISSRNQGYDTRLIIRGAGLKAPYGIREIMVLLNGVQITDPDSLTRLDFVDTSLIERIEVVKGPNSTLWGVNSAGGVINVITRSPFERKGGFIKLGFGDFSSQNHNLYYSTPLGKGFYLGFNASRRQTENSWRPWNKFWTNQITLRPYTYVKYPSVPLERLLKKYTHKGSFLILSFQQIPFVIRKGANYPTAYNPNILVLEVICILVIMSYCDASGTHAKAMSVVCLKVKAVYPGVCIVYSTRYRVVVLPMV